MHPLVLRLIPSDFEDLGEDSCGLCGTPIRILPGPQIFLLASSQQLPVCRSCGVQHAPHLTALVNLAQIAQRVGQISRHRRTWVPMEALLELSRASEDYFAFAAGEKRPV